MAMIRLSFLGIVAIAAVGGCGGAPYSSASSKKVWPLSGVQTLPAQITAISGTTFRCGGVRCQLLGVQESNDAAIRAQADKFTRAWFKDIGNCIGIYNGSNPLVAEDGTAVVWVCGYYADFPCLSAELVRAGFVEIDAARWPDYTFTVDTKGATKVEDWREVLREAKKGHDNGEKPRVLFDWPME